MFGRGDGTSLESIELCSGNYTYPCGEWTWCWALKVSCRMLLVGSLFQRFPRNFIQGFLDFFIDNHYRNFAPEDVGLLQWIIVTPLRFNMYFFPENDYLEDVFFLLGPGLVSGSMLVLGTASHAHQTKKESIDFWGTQTRHIKDEMFACTMGGADCSRSTRNKRGL